MKQQPKGVVVPVPRTERTVFCRTSPGLFSADRLDDGTRLLLAHLPPGDPSDVLDLGCGWGAISVAVASAFPSARVRAVDRDLLAVATTAANATALGLGNVSAEGGIGTSGLDDSARFDWALCNVPARIGAGGIGVILAGCARRLRPGGELRVVVIEALTSTTVGSARSYGLAAEEVARSANHRVIAVAPADVTVDEADMAPYLRDEVTIAGRLLFRPFDFGEDPAHLGVGLPLLLDLLPRQANGARAAVVRAGYGAIPLELAARGARTIAVERDLLAAAFIGRNAARHRLEVEARTSPWLPDALPPSVDLAVVEPAEPMGAAEALRELAEARARLSGTGAMLCLARARFAEVLRTATTGARVLASRGGFTVLEVRATRN